MMKHINDKHPNFYSKDGRFNLVRCYYCDPKNGVENYVMNVTLGCCTWCGWDVALETDKDYAEEVNN
jgi:hypothetical protein